MPNSEGDVPIFSLIKSDQYDENTEDHPAYDTYDAHHSGIKFFLNIINKNFKLKE